MIRRSTLVFLTCLGALGAPALSTQAAATPASALMAQATIAQATIAQATEGASANVLSIGSRGRAVRALQTRLQETGYYSGSVDGVYGVGTLQAVVAFQEDQGFEPTGRLDDATWEALEAYDPAAANGTQQSAPGEPVAPASPASAPAGDIPPTGEPAAADAATADASSPGVTRTLGLGIGLAALLASFGVGFFMANRSRSEGEDELAAGEEWSAAGVPATSSGSIVPSTAPAISGGDAFDNGTAIATVPVDARGSQLGSVAPMARADIFEGLLKDLHNPDPHQRRKVIWELGQRGNSLAVQPLVDAMVDADSKEKSLVLAALSEIGIRSLRPMNRALAIALQDDNPEVRKNAIRDLTRIYELVVQISHMLGNAQEDEDPEVRQTASWALEQLNRIRQTQDVDSNMRSLPTNSPKTNRFAL